MKQRLARKMLVLGLSLIWGIGYSHNQSSPVDRPLDISILHINDSHSRLDEDTINLHLQTGEGTRALITTPIGGFARVTALMNSLATSSPNPIKIHAGDAITGDLYFTQHAGKAEAALLNIVCFDTLTLGNHEFDNRDNGLKKFLEFLHAGPCKTQALSANVRFGASSELKESSLVKPLILLEREGQNIGIIGLTSAHKTKNASRPNDDTTFDNEIVTAQAHIDQLKARGINKIIVQSHIGYAYDQTLARQLRGVDVIIGGDSHTLLGPNRLTGYGLTPAGDYPARTTDKEGNPVCIAQAWQYAYVVGQLNVRFDQQGKVTHCSGTPHVVLGEQFKRADPHGPALTPAQIDSIRADIRQSDSLRLVRPDTTALGILAPYKAAREALASKHIATAPEHLCLRRIPGITRDMSRSVLGDTCNKNPRVNQHGGDMQQMVAEAVLMQGKKFFNADISLLNAGSVRADMAKGPVTVGQVYRTLPFKNTLVQLKATGQEIKNILEQAIQGVLVNHNSGSYPYAGGLRWEMDFGKPPGQRVSKLQVRQASNRHVPLDLSKTYTLVSSDFLADGQDFYTGFKAIEGERRIDVGLDYAEAFLNYINDHRDSGAIKTLSLLPIAYYSTQQFTDTP